jgi:hypothetical protein
MSNKKYYKRMKRTLMAGAGTGIMAGMIFVSSNTALADTETQIVPPYSQNTSHTGMHMMRRWNSPAKVNALASSLGLDKEEVALELKSGKNLKQILQDNGIVPGQIQKALTTKRGSSNKNWKKI